MPSDALDARQFSTAPSRPFRRRSPTRLLTALALSAALAGCISFGPKAPKQLLTLSPTATIPAGTTANGVPADSLAVLIPGAPQRLSVTRVPVQTSDSSLAYLKDAVWVERPSQLFRNLLAETIRARGNRLVVDGGELEYAASSQLSGQLIEMGYDAVTGSATVRYDAVLQLPDGGLRTRRFESSIPAIAPEAAAVGPALNQAANAVALEVADWLNAMPSTTPLPGGR